MRGAPGKSCAVVVAPHLLPSSSPTALEEHRTALAALVDAHDELMAQLSAQGKALVSGVMLRRVIVAKRVLGEDSVSESSSDRELLDLAAKAAGHELHDVGYGPYIIASDGMSSGWNPLDDDGDALRLAVKLEIDLVHCYPDAIQASYFEIEEAFAKGQDPFAATRRAIVRAAAEIGKALP